MFGWLFGKNKKQLKHEEHPGDSSDPVRDLVRLQQAYWTWKPAEWADLQARGLERLSWPQRLRLHHLNCLALLEQEPFRSQLSKDGVPTETEPATPSDQVRRCRESAARLLAEDSPYGPALPR